MAYIGGKKIKETKVVEGFQEVEFEDGTKEVFTDLMYKAICGEEACDASKLREKRIFPVVQAVLEVLKNWGIKLNELPFMSAVLNQSLKINEEEAIKELWTKWIPTINSIDDVDLVAVDRVLKSKAINESKEIISPYNAK